MRFQIVFSFISPLRLSLRFLQLEGMKFCLLFNDTLSTFYLQLHSDSETNDPLLPLHGILFPISSKVFFMHHRIVQRPL